MNKNVQELLYDYLEYLEIDKNRSEKTTENYQRYLTRFFDWGKIKKIEDINEEKVHKFRFFLANSTNNEGESLKRKTQNGYVIAIRNFLSFLLKKNYASLNPDKIELGKNEDRVVDFLEKDELEALFRATEGESLKSLRDQAILELLFSSGLRVSELVSLNRDKFDLEKGEFIIKGKGGKNRIFFISSRAKGVLFRYLEKRKDIDQAFFIRILRHPEKTTSSLRLSPRSIQRIVQEIAKKAGLIKTVTPHTLRHTFATDLIQNGADIRSVQALLGHSSIGTTQIYTHVTNQSLREAYQKFHGKQLEKS